MIEPYPAALPWAVGFVRAARRLGGISIGIGSNAGFGGTTDAGFNAFMAVASADLSVDGRDIVRKGRIL